MLLVIVCFIGITFLAFDGGYGQCFGCLALLDHLYFLLFIEVDHSGLLGREREVVTAHFADQPILLLRRLDQEHLEAQRAEIHG